LTDSETSVVPTSPPSAPKPILPRSLIKKTPGHKLTLLEIDPQEMARQITILDFLLFSAIQPREFLGLGWLKGDKDLRSPNIVKMTTWSNHIVSWLTTEILAHRDIKSRVKIMDHIVAIAMVCFANGADKDVTHYVLTRQHLDKLNNFNGIKEVLAALQCSAVYRLKKTKDVRSYLLNCMKF
jgi:hypothetical protein